MKFLTVLSVTLIIILLALLAGNFQTCKKEQEK